MTKLINAMTGTDMWVDDSRVEEYLNLGHKRPGKAAKARETKPSKKADASEAVQPQEAAALEDARPQETAAPESEVGE